MSADRTALRKRLKALKNVPTLPGVFEKISRLASRPDTTAEAFAAVISSDQALSAKILRVVNCAWHGFPGRISNVTHALIILGFDVVRGLVLSTSVFDMMLAQGLHGLWEHSLGCAMGAGIIAKKTRHPNPEEVSVAGLLHDIGKVIIKIELADESAEIDRLVAAEQISVYEAEERILGFTHSLVGSWLCQEWNLPNKLTDPITYHHKPNLARFAQAPAAIVHVADSLVRAVGFGSGGDPFVPPIDHGTWRQLHISDTELEEVVDELSDQLEDSDRFLPSERSEI